MFQLSILQNSLSSLNGFRKCIAGFKALMGTMDGESLCVGPGAGSYQSVEECDVGGWKRANG